MRNQIYRVTIYAKTQTSIYREKCAQTHSGLAIVFYVYCPLHIRMSVYINRHSLIPLIFKMAKNNVITRNPATALNGAQNTLSAIGGFIVVENKNLFFHNPSPFVWRDNSRARTTRLVALARGAAQGSPRC